ncbi:hypothetical protein [Comamonas sp. GB3 AK4-5]|uniref:hypothetical protein n=1 Tax=Comamonas sp. GB3 AK4-5 TaxID=3231487 RepID=UPI00351ECA1D
MPHASMPHAPHFFLDGPSCALASQAFLESLRWLACMRLDPREQYLIPYGNDGTRFPSTADAPVRMLNAAQQQTLGRFTNTRLMNFNPRQERHSTRITKRQASANEVQRLMLRPQNNKPVQLLERTPYIEPWCTLFMYAKKS